MFTFGAEALLAECAVRLSPVMHGSAPHLPTANMLLTDLRAHDSAHCTATPNGAETKG
jgi:hypothetical protein